MRGPDGTDMPNRGVYLEVVPNERLVVTDAYTEAWVPAQKPFMTVILTFADEDGGTRYTLGPVRRPARGARRHALSPGAARPYGVAPPRHHARMPFCACRRFSASSNTTDCGPSITSAVTSSPRCAGRQCMNSASLPAAAIRRASTR